jgi:large subunit ribosomal protein L25
MSEQYGNLTVSVRHKKGKGTARKLRAAGQIPGVVYGQGISKEGGSVLLSLSPAELLKALDPDRRHNTLFTLTIQQDGKPDISEICVIADAQLDAIREEYLHVDFLRVDPEIAVTAKIPVSYSGRSAGVVAGGSLKTFRRFVRIAAKPAEIPVSFDVDVTPLEIGESMRLKEVPLTNATLVDNPETVVAFVDTAKAEIEEETPEEAKEAPKEGEGDGEAEAAAPAAN